MPYSERDGRSTINMCYGSCVKSPMPVSHQTTVCAHHRFTSPFSHLSESGQWTNTRCSRCDLGGRSDVHPLEKRVCLPGNDPGRLFTSLYRMECVHSHRYSCGSGSIRRGHSDT